MDSTTLRGSSPLAEDGIVQFRGLGGVEFWFFDAVEEVLWEDAGLGTESPKTRGTKGPRGTRGTTSRGVGAHSAEGNSEGGRSRGSRSRGSTAGGSRGRGSTDGIQGNAKVTRGRSRGSRGEGGRGRGSGGRGSRGNGAHSTERDPKCGLGGGGGGGWGGDGGEDREGGGVLLEVNGCGQAVGVEGDGQRRSGGTWGGPTWRILQCCQLASNSQHAFNVQIFQ